MSLKSSQEIIEKKIFTQDGREIGHVVGLEIELSSWEVRALEIRLRRDALEPLKIKRPLFGTRSMRLSVEHVSGVTDTVVLKTKLDEVGALLSGPDEEGEAPQDETEK